MVTIQPNLNWHKATAIADINRTIGAVRLKYITDIPGQEAIYQAKRDEAARYLAELPVTLAEFPLMDAEVGVTAPTAAELAALWVGMDTQWRSLAAQLEKLRMVASQQVAAAADKNDTQKAVDDLYTALEASGL